MVEGRCTLRGTDGVGDEAFRLRAAIGRNQATDQFQRSDDTLQLIVEVVGDSIGQLPHGRCAVKLK